MHCALTLPWKLLFHTLNIITAPNVPPTHTIQVQTFKKTKTESFQSLRISLTCIDWIRMCSHTGLDGAQRALNSLGQLCYATHYVAGCSNLTFQRKAYIRWVTHVYKQMSNDWHSPVNTNICSSISWKSEDQFILIIEPWDQILPSPSNSVVLNGASSLTG